MPTTWPYMFTRGPPGVARVDGRVGLDVGHAVFAVLPHLPVQAGDDPPGQRAGETARPRGCRCQHPLPDGELPRVPELGRGKAVVVGLDHRQVRGPVRAHHHRVVLLAVIGGHLHVHALGVEHHVGVGDDIPVRRGDDPRAGAVRLFAVRVPPHRHRHRRGRHLVVNRLGVHGLPLGLLLNLDAPGRWGSRPPRAGAAAPLFRLLLGLGLPGLLVLVGQLGQVVLIGRLERPRARRRAVPQVDGEPQHSPRRQDGGHPQEHLQPQGAASSWAGAVQGARRKGRSRAALRSRAAARKGTPPCWPYTGCWGYPPWAG